MSDAPAIAYYMSERAYGHLVFMAQKQGYIPWGAERAKGLSEFLNDLAHYALEDTRPELVRMRHEEEISHNRAPSWHHTRLRRARLLKLDENAIEKYFESALIFGILREEPFAVGGPQRNTPYPAIAYVLEGIGLEWLTPVDLPRNYD
jgi:hypothetical protein